MNTHIHKRAYFTLEAMNAIATTYFGYYLYFYLHERFGFGNFENLAFGALNGFIYMFSASAGGKYAQRRGYFRALKVGFSIMAGFLLFGLVAPGIAGQIVVLAGWTIGMCFTWPTLAALVSEGEQPPRLQKLIGIYNVVWSGASAIAYFFGGALLARLGLTSLFYLPAAIHIAQLGLLLWLEKRPSNARVSSPQEKPAAAPSAEGRNRAQNFLRLAWIANPFAYVAINTIIAMAPTLAGKMGLSTAWAGILCSTWLFVRMGAFVLLWLWQAWHYRFRWFITSYIAMLASFLLILLTKDLVMVIGAQILFGCATGLIYYSSLYYSMDVGETKGEHGGFHEAAIGAGLFLGPATGAVALKTWPGSSMADTWGVTSLLVAGLLLLVLSRLRSRRILLN